MEELASDPNLDELVSGNVSPSAIAQLAAQVGRGAKSAGAGAVASGRWLAEWMVDNAPRITVRDHATLIADNDGLTGDRLANALIAKAARASAAVGAATGALMTAEELLPPAWFTLPFELVVETLAIAAIEMRLVGELHEVYYRPIPGTPSQRGSALVRAWADRRGVSPAVIASSAGLAEVLGHRTRSELVRLVRRRVLRRMSGNVASIGPFLIGAAASAALNRRITRLLGEAVAKDLRGS